LPGDNVVLVRKEGAIVKKIQSINGRQIMKGKEVKKK